jgi:hypothetical protein
MGYSRFANFFESRFDHFRDLTKRVVLKNCQARAEEKIKEEYDLSESTARMYVRDYMKARNSEN